MLEIEALTVGYGPRTILRDLNLNVAAGELLGVIGPNGCGKSTLIKAVSGVLKPTAGRVRLEGRDFLRLRPEERARILAVVTQNPSLPEAFTAAEIVLLGRTPHLGAFQQESEADLQIVEEAMRAADCWEMAQRPVGELSGGERQRVLFALALAQQPRFLLLDEPTTYLDINYQVNMMDMTIEWLRAGSTRGALAVFHDLNLAAQYCHRLALLSAGKVLSVGRPAEVITTDNIRRAYGASVIIMPHPVNDLPTTLILPHQNP